MAKGWLAHIGHAILITAGVVVLVGCSAVVYYFMTLPAIPELNITETGVPATSAGTGQITFQKGDITAAQVEEAFKSQQQRIRSLEKQIADLSRDVGRPKQGESVVAGINRLDQRITASQSYMMVVFVLALLGVVFGILGFVSSKRRGSELRELRAELDSAKAGASNDPPAPAPNVKSRDGLTAPPQSQRSRIADKQPERRIRSQQPFDDGEERYPVNFGGAPPPPPPPPQPAPMRSTIDIGLVRTLVANSGTMRASEYRQNAERLGDCVAVDVDGDMLSVAREDDGVTQVVMAIFDRNNFGILVPSHQFTKDFGIGNQKVRNAEEKLGRFFHIEVTKSGPLRYEQACQIERTGGTIRVVEKGRLSGFTD